MTSPRIPALLSTTAVAFVLALAAFGAQAFELRGFRGVHWGEAADSLRGEALVQADGDVRCYARDRENLIFGDTPLQGVHYCFHHDRLVMVVLDAPVARDALSNEFQRTYGKPESRRSGVDSWGGAPSATTAQVTALGPKASRITLSVSHLDAGAAQRMARLSSAETGSGQRVAFAY